MSAPKDFDQWWTELKALGVACDWDADMVHPAAWEWYFENGFTPEEALAKQMAITD